MSEPDYSGVQDVHVPHEAEVAEAIDSQMRRTSAAVAIDDVEDLPTYQALTPLGTASETYLASDVQGAMDGVDALAAALADNDTATQALVDAVNGILQVLRDAELIPESEA